MAARKKSEEPSINIDEVLTDEELKAVANESEPAEHKAKSEDVRVPLSWPRTKP